MSNLNNSLEILFSKMENFVSSKTVVGEPISIGDAIIVPLVDVSVAVGAGATINDSKTENGGGGLGAKITPSSVMVIKNNTVQLVNVKNQSSIDKLIDMIPGVTSKFDFLFNSKQKLNNDSTDNTNTNNADTTETTEE